MAVVTRQISELCIGKPALWPLPITATVGDALRRLRCPETSSSSSSLSVWDNKVVVGRVSVTDVVCYLCSEDRLADPAAALRDPISALLFPKDSLVRRVEPYASILEALDVILDSGAQNLVVPIRSSTAAGRKKLHHLTGGTEFCLLTQEDFIRFFLNSISLFCPSATHSVAELGLVRHDVLRVLYSDPAISAVPLLRRAITAGTSVAVVADDGCLIGEISPSAVSYCDEAVIAAATAVLSAGELMSYIDFGGAPPESAVRHLTSKLQENNQTGMLELLEEEIASTDHESLVFSSSASSSDDDEVSSETSSRRRKLRRGRSWGGYSAKETVVCHPESSLVAVMVQALAHRVSYMWVAGDDYDLLGIVTFDDILRVFRGLL